ncbi:hypothetical protein LSUE1_G008168 [Lachnellula suecica]|uniref:SH3 domain-containing protein n=1 Tax=Lachnellula suecica TaxID=602035 RepID=A0A8T9C8U2_9HELO|nr:hypothetical protein LSUE1_G008168 [Lachnellula suecica]
MSNDIAPGVKSILKAIDSGIKLGKRVARSSVYAPAAQVLQISESASNLQKSLEGSSKAIKDAYDISVKKCGEPFVNALLNERENNQLKELRIDLIDHSDKCQDFDENPLLFDPVAFTNLQKEGEKCCVQCIAIFHAVEEGLLDMEIQSFTMEEDIRDDRGFLSSMRSNRENSRDASTRDASARKPVPPPSRQPAHVGQLQITPPRPLKQKSSWAIDNPSNFELGSPVSAISSVTASFGVSPRTMGPALLAQDPGDALLVSPNSAQGTQLIPWELVHSRIATNDEFLERRRNSRTLFQDEIQRSVNSIEEDRASETFSDGVMRLPISGVAEMQGSSPVEEHTSRTSSSGYDTFISRQRSQGQASQATRSSRASSIYPLTPPMSEHSASGSTDKWQTMASALQVPRYGSNVEEGLEVVPNTLTERQLLAASEKEANFTTEKEIPYETGIEATFDPDNEKMLDAGNEKMLVTEEHQSHFQSTSAASVRSVDHPMRHDSSFYKSGGFCEGARAMMRGETGFKVAKRPSGHYSATVSAKCLNCAYEVGWNDVEKDRLLDRSGIYGSSGIRWRQKFISKCHVKTTSIEEPLYACVFCIEDNKTVEEHDATVFFSVSQLFRHLAKHTHPLPKVAGLQILYGYQPAEVLDFDIHFTTTEPKPSQWNMTEIATKVATRASAYATIAHHPKLNARTARDPDGDETLHFAAGAKIVGITYPERFNGQWCVGYHDGDRGSFPAANIMIERPAKEEVLMNPQSSLIATARWDHKPKDSKDGGWLKFSKGDKISCVGYQYQDQWCWSGQSSKGKWGLFPAAFVENLQDGGKLPPPSPTSTKGGFASRMPSFAIGRNKSSKTDRAASVRSVGSAGSAGNVAVYGQPGLEVARSIIGSRKG